MTIFEFSSLDEEQQKVIINWLKKSGIAINASKTKAAYFALQELSNPLE